MKSLLLLLISPLLVTCWGGWGGQKYEKIRLRDVQVLTLRSGEMTTGRRSSPVAQLSCVGGSGAGQGWEPGVVQCYNRGWDGREVQWECKADMEPTVRFGKVEVVCEGYDYPEDDFILAGSCGLEYTLELTREGRQQHNRGGGGGGGWFSGSTGGYQQNSYNSYYDTDKSTSGLGDLIIIVVVCIVIYAFYKTCIDSNSLGDTQYSSTNEDYGSGYPGMRDSENIFVIYIQLFFPGAGGWSDPNRGNNYGGGGGNNYYGGGSDSCGGRRQRGTGAGGMGGGFWTGAATGGLLGYMFGNRGTGYNTGGYRRGWGWGGSGGYNRGYSTGGGSWGGSGTTTTSSSGTRTASGFGGTRRR